MEEVERLAIERAKALFSVGYVNVQPHSGAQANMAVLLSLMKPKDPLLGMDLSHGGHLSHGSPKSFSGHLLSAFFYGVDREKERIDFQHLRQLARKCRPKVIIAGASAYPRTLDFAAFREMAEEAGAFLLADIAHIAGLVAAGIHPSPVPFAHAPPCCLGDPVRHPHSDGSRDEGGGDARNGSQDQSGLAGLERGTLQGEDRGASKRVMLSIPHLCGSTEEL